MSWGQGPLRAEGSSPGEQGPWTRKLKNKGHTRGVGGALENTGEDPTATPKGMRHRGHTGGVRGSGWHRLPSVAEGSAEGRGVVSGCKQAMGGQSCVVCGTRGGRTRAQNSMWEWEVLPLERGTLKKSESTEEYQH